MHIEDTDDGSSFLSKKQTKLLSKVLMCLMGYFGIYYLSGQLDLYLVASEELEKINILPAFIGLELAFCIQIYLNFKTRKEILARTKPDGIEQGAFASLFSSTGLTTIFNAMT